MLIRATERLLFASRWLLVPFLIGLVAGLVLLLLRFVKAVWELTQFFWLGSDKDLLTGLLSLVELALFAALIVIVILSCYENFVSRISNDERLNWPEWMGHLDFAQLKRKLIATISTIASVQILKEIESIDDLTNRYLGWLIGMQLVFVATAVLLALSDRIAFGVSERGSSGLQPARDGAQRDVEPRRVSLRP
ncbi:MAG: YqhA family protein [Hyphomicrobiales bacterium]|nr:YqhA family protein [Hyphomicrobiales bacterium]